VGPYRDNVVVGVQGGEAAEHLRSHSLNIIGAKAPDTARQSDGAQQAALLPATHGVLVNPKRAGDLSNLHELRHLCSFRPQRHAT
jgi:hypothetical protein